MKAPADYDVVIIGGGPGGSTAGAYLARSGRKVLVLEKETFPRFHIGESLLPFGNEIMQETGVWEKIEKAGFMPKLGAEFCTSNSARFNRIWFSRGLTTDFTQTFQVERSKFDHILLKHAAECGCDVREGSLVHDLAFDPDGARVTFKNGGAVREISCRWVIDASGRDAFLGRHLKLERAIINVPKKIATYAHFSGVYRNAGDAAGHIMVVRLPSGWFWFIPLDEEKTSVGLVQPLEEFRKAGGRGETIFEETVGQHEELQFRLQNAQRVSQYYSTSDYTYRHKIAAGQRWLLVGDAGGFMDPIFSSGVMVAMKTARLAFRAIESADAGNRGLARREIRNYTRSSFSMMDLYLEMIRNFYDNEGFEVFIDPVRSRWKIPEAVISILAGNTRFVPGIWWRMRVFFLICRLQKWFPMAPHVTYTPRRKARQPEPVT